MMGFVAVVVIAAILVFAAFALLLGGDRYPRASLGPIQLDRPNRTYAPNENITLGTEIEIATTELQVQYSAVLIVEDESGTEVYRERIAGGRIAITPTPSGQRFHRVFSFSDGIESTLTLGTAGRYRLRIEATVGKHRDTRGRTLRVV